MRLAAFKRVALKPGETRRITLTAEPTLPPIMRFGNARYGFIVCASTVVVLTIARSAASPVAVCARQYRRGDRLLAALDLARADAGRGGEPGHAFRQRPLRLHRLRLDRRGAHHRAVGGVMRHRNSMKP
jgi:hypothetical protein